MLNSEPRWWFVVYAAGLGALASGAAWVGGRHGLAYSASLA
jgi:hypothetical protein